ncbi:hypothetical protein EJ06DRAFT_533448 [Trichodelitschia bisporula]|uniref:Uncharacterized protein n=1 Tax=Trichodelitschia bisporula TaxID=703511 RepID=A0A6G1HMG9_9PEZI|nr:hypothetical protein EJ06DRAFT_533448 [Trichodelitschia bisporula]
MATILLLPLAFALNHLDNKRTTKRSAAIEASYQSTTMATARQPAPPYTSLPTSNPTDTAAEPTDSPLNVDVNALTLDEKAELQSLRSSISAPPAYAPSPFTPTSTLHIACRGQPLLRLPLAPTELEIPIHAADGTRVYTSVRAKRSSGDSELVAEGRGAVVQTEYFFGPGRAPRITLLGDGAVNVLVRSRWCSREQRFVLPNQGEVGWVYRRERDEVAGKKVSRLVLEVGEGKEVVRLAQLVRNEESRAPGSKRCDAGNGGALEMDARAMERWGVGEEVVVATCLLMLKKEIDRRRVVQMMVIAGVVGGAS